MTEREFYGKKLFDAHKFQFGAPEEWSGLPSWMRERWASTAALVRAAVWTDPIAALRHQLLAGTENDQQIAQRAYDLGARPK